MLRALGLGDFLTAVPALRALADAFPGHRRVLAAPAGIAPLAHLSATVDEVVDSAPLAPLDPSLAGADVAVNLHGRGPESTGALLATRPRRLIGFGHGSRWLPGEHEVRRWCRLLEESGVAADRSRLDLPRPPSAGLDRDPPRRRVRRPPVAPRAASEVARHEAAQGRIVVVTGSSDERPIASTMRST